MQPKDFLYFLLDKDNKSYYLNGGIVDTTTTPTPIDHSPDGWQDTSIKWERDITRYFSPFRNFTTPYKFVKNAAKMIRTRLYQYGTEDKIQLLILWLDKTFTGGWVHRTFFKGDLDLSQAQDELTEITTPITDGNFMKLLKANESTAYEIPIPGTTKVQDDGIVLQETGNFNYVDGLELKFINAAGNVLLPYLPVPLIFINKEGTSSGIDFTGQDTSVPPLNSYFATGWTGNQTTINLKVTGSFSFRVNENGRDNISVALYHIVDGAYIAGDRVQLANFNPAFDGQTYTATINATVPVGASDSWALMAEAPLSGSGRTSITILPGGVFNASFQSRYISSFTPVMTPIQLGQALLDKITGGGYTLVSEYITNYWNGLTITSGDAIRGIANPVIKTSWTDFFDSLFVPTEGIAMSVDGKNVILTVLKKSFDNTDVLDLGEANDCKISPDKDFQYNGISIGYPNLDSSTYESLNAKEEFNVTSTFTTNITRSTKPYELVSKYKASMYEQELARINLDGKDTTAASVDSTVFFKLLEKTPYNVEGGISYYKYFRDTYDSITGLLDPASAYNIPLSPMNCLVRHGAFIRSLFYWQAGQKLVFQTSDQNATLKTVKGGVTIQESADVMIGSLDEPLFIPIDFDITSQMPRELIDVMATNPNGTFSFSWLGNTYYGFAKSISIQPANRPQQDSTLICSPKTDLSKLIH